MVRWVAGVLFVVGGILHAEDPAAGLSKEKAADGWLMMFDGETTFGWKADGGVKVAEGSLVIGGDNDSTATCTTSFGPGKIEFEYYIEKEPTGSLVLNGNVIATADPNSLNSWKNFEHEFNDGPVKIGFSVPAGGVTKIRNLHYRPNTDKELFNGKDLSGWKVIPNHKSKFTVTSEGWLNIKDGNGDIQTEGEWDNFVLQLDIISNGKHLNSGVFYRAIPGEFWSGYEAQIRNQWKGENRKEPVDFGTGGIYNRQPARKVVPSDKEWFTMTVVANGNHHAVWVNGYQTADFTDTKPMADSARRGRKDGKGCISLQGHDPTTDLSFKNIKLQELPKVE